MRHWGPPRALRHVAVFGRVDGRATPGTRLRIGFQSADWSPWQALVRLRRAWPALAFDLRAHRDVEVKPAG